MDNQSTDYDDNTLIINEVSKEVLNSITTFLSNLKLPVNLGNLTNLTSIALINNDNQVVLFRTGAQKKPLALFLNGATVERTICYTTYDATKPNGKRSCVHRETVIDGVPKTQTVCLENGCFYDEVTKLNYFLECNPTQNYPNRALLFEGEFFTDDSGRRRCRKVAGAPFLLDER